MTSTIEAALKNAPPAPPIKRRFVSDERPLASETQSLLIKLHVISVKHWRN